MFGWSLPGTGHRRVYATRPIIPSTLNVFEIPVPRSFSRGLGPSRNGQIHGVSIMHMYDDAASRYPVICHTAPQRDIPKGPPPRRQWGPRAAMRCVVFPGVDGTQGSTLSPVAHVHTPIPRCTVMTKHYPCTSCSLSHETSFPSPASPSRPYVHADPIRGARLGPSQTPIVLDRIMSCDTLTDRPKESMTQSMAQLPCTCWPTGTCGSSLGQCDDVCTLHCLFRDTVDGTWGRHAMLHDTHLWPQRGDDPVRCPVRNARAAIPPRALRHGAPYGRTRSQSKRSATTCGMCAVSCDLAKCQHDWTAPCRVTPRLLGVAAHVQRSMRPKTQGKPAGNGAT